jgi:hypothetical protein
MGLLAPFKALGKLFGRIFGVAKERGLTEDLVRDTVTLVETAAAKFTDTRERREWVVAALQAMGIAESIARLAVELAVQIWKRSR